MRLLFATLEVYIAIVRHDGLRTVAEFARRIAPAQCNPSGNHVSLDKLGQTGLH